MTKLRDEEIEQLWAQEAVRRDAEIDSGAASLRNAKDVFSDARTRLSTIKDKQSKVRLRRLMCGVAPPRRVR